MCGRFVLEVDENGHRRLLLDVATVHAGTPKVIAEGLLQSGEQDFPLALLAAAFDLDIAQGEASQEQDKRRILNCICGVHPTQLDVTVPPLTHEKYEEVTRITTKWCTCYVLLR